VLPLDGCLFLFSPSFHSLTCALFSRHSRRQLKKYFTFEVQVLDDKNVRRRFRASNYQSTTRVKPFICTMPMRLDEGWNQIQFNLSDFTRRAYASTSPTASTPRRSSRQSSSSSSPSRSRRLPKPAYACAGARTGRYRRIHDTAVPLRAPARRLLWAARARGRAHALLDAVGRSGQKRRTERVGLGNPRAAAARMGAGQAEVSPSIVALLSTWEQVRFCPRCDLRAAHRCGAPWSESCFVSSRLLCNARLKVAS
jgi:hypothetical protein